jgi:putative tryptophan/tyrosine transport system substrate-binding protein
MPCHAQNPAYLHRHLLRQAPFKIWTWQRLREVGDGSSVADAVRSPDAHSSHQQNCRGLGWLVTGSPTAYRFSLIAFLDGLKVLGYVEGQNCRIEYKWAEGNITRLPDLANELVQQNVDVILAGGSVGAEAAKRATSVIPIVAAGVGDLVELGLVESLARPGGNLTGFAASAPEFQRSGFKS